MDDPTYFRNVFAKKDKLTLTVEAPMTDKMNSTVSVVFQDDENRSKNGGGYVKVTGPPCLVIWPHLHATGNHPEKQSDMKKAEFGVTLREEDLPAALLKKWPGLVKEQKDFFDGLSDLVESVYVLMAQHPEVDKEWKATEMEDLMDRPEQERSKILLKKFVKKANKNAVVKKIKDTSIRYFGMKTKIARGMKLTGKKHSNTGYAKGKMAPEDPEHYINKLAKDDLEYCAPLIRDFKGMKIDLGMNENPYVNTGDLVIPSFLIKVYDCPASVGVRMMYSGITILRRAKPDEQKGYLRDFSCLATDEDEEEQENDSSDANAWAFE